MANFETPPGPIIEKLGYSKNSLPLPEWSSGLGKDGSNGLRFGADGGMLPIPLKLALEHDKDIIFSYDYKLLRNGKSHINTALMALNKPKSSSDLKSIDFGNMTIKKGIWVSCTVRIERRGEVCICMRWMAGRPVGIWKKWLIGSPNDPNYYKVQYIHGRNVVIDNIRIQIAPVDLSVGETSIPRTRRHIVQKEPLHLRWSFADGFPEDLLPVRGKWVWRSGGQADDAGMIPKPGEPVVVELPIEMPRRPFVVSMKARPDYFADSGGVSMYWSGATKQLSGNSRRVKYSDKNRFAKQGNVFRYWFWGRWCAAFKDGELCLLQRYEKPYPASRIILKVNNFEMKDLEIRFLNEKDIPQELQKPEALFGGR